MGTNVAELTALLAKKDAKIKELEVTTYSIFKVSKSLVENFSIYA